MRRSNFLNIFFRNKIFFYKLIFFVSMFFFLYYYNTQISIFLYKFNTFFKKFNYISKQEKEKINIMNNLIQEDKFKIVNDSDFEIVAIYFTGSHPHAILNLKKSTLNVKNLLIVNENRVLVGIIYNLLDKNSKMYFLHSLDVNLPVFTSETKNYGLMISDPFDKNCKLKIKYNDSPLKENEIITSSGENGLIESGVLIGRTYFRNKDICVESYHNIKLTHKLYLFKKD